MPAVPTRGWGWSLGSKEGAENDLRGENVKVPGLTRNGALLPNPKGTRSEQLKV